jgi:patatin-like phospholipase/acyl hydrolase
MFRYPTHFASKAGINRFCKPILPISTYLPPSHSLPAHIPNSCSRLHNSFIPPLAPTSHKIEIEEALSQKKTYNILSIDGGGIRGIIPAMLLCEIEKRTGKPISELFDYVAGTSTGGILALGLNAPSEGDPHKPRYSAKDLLEVYEKHGNEIFSPGDISQIIECYTLTYLIGIGGSIGAAIGGAATGESVGITVGATIGAGIGGAIAKAIEKTPKKTTSIGAGALAGAVLMNIWAAGLSFLGYTALDSLSQLNISTAGITIRKAVELILGITVGGGIGTTVGGNRGGAIGALIGVIMCTIIFAILFSRKSNQSESPEKISSTQQIFQMSLTIAIATIIISKLSPLIWTKYSHTHIEKLFSKYFENLKISAALKETMVTSFEAKTNTPALFTRHAAKQNPGNDIFMREAVRATSAAPSFFNPFLKKQSTYIDGGIIANNPSMNAYTNSLKHRGAQQPYIVSLGTGSYNPAQTGSFQNHGLLQWGLMRKLLKTMMQGSARNVDLQMNELLGSKYYQRIQLELENNISLDHASEKVIKELKVLAEKYIKDNSAVIDEICQKLLNDLEAIKRTGP